MGPIIVLVILNLAPAVFYLVMICKKGSLDSQQSRESIGTLYQTVDITKRGSGSYIIVYLLRRSFFVFVTFVFFDYPGFQIQIFLFSCVYYILYLNYVPSFKEKMSFTTEVLNEGLFLIMCYHFVLFIGLIWDQKPKRNTGTSLLVFLFVFFAVNLAIIIFVSVKGLIRSKKLSHYKKKRDAILKTRKTNIQMIKSAQVLNRVMFKESQFLRYKLNERVYDQEIKFINAMSNY